ncbi:hypothetical protein HBH70_089800 [Parastagonospora nodorum]|nr:hypothetical protein HBH70_089800 [Parastagonospora nodorum]
MAYRPLETRLMKVASRRTPNLSFGPASNEVDVIVINPAAFTHRGVAIRDDLLEVDIPFIEIHVTNTHARGVFSHHSHLSNKTEAVIMGMGRFVYVVAVEHAVKNVKSRRR